MFAVYLPLLLAAYGPAAVTSRDAAVENVLVFVVDDLRPPAPGTFTPNIDALRRNGTTFTRAYTQVAICGPSRASFLTSLRPNQNRVWTIGPNFRFTMPNDTRLSGHDVVTMPQLFKDSGFNTTGSGKVRCSRNVHPKYCVWSALLLLNLRVATCLSTFAPTAVVRCSTPALRAAAFRQTRAAATCPIRGVSLIGSATSFTTAPCRVSPCNSGQPIPTGQQRADACSPRNVWSA